MKIKIVLASACAIALAGCGADETAFTPVETNRAPPPTPSPTPGPTYVDFNDLTGEQVFHLACATADQLLPYGRVAPIRYHVETGVWRAGDNGGDPAIEYGPQDIVENRPGEFTRYVVDRRNASNQLLNGLTVTVPRSGADVRAKYLRALFLDLLYPESQRARLDRRQSCVFGVPTLASDLAIPAPNIYAEHVFTTGWGRLASGAAYDLSESHVSVTYDPAERRLALSIIVRGRERSDDPVAGEIPPSQSAVTFGTFNGTARIGDLDPGYLGTLKTDDGSEVGGFAGWFFGPEASEIGLVLHIAAASDSEQTEAPDENVFALLVAGQRD